jgi:hypothetical protein
VPGSLVVRCDPEVTREGLCLPNPLAAEDWGGVAVSGQCRDVVTQEARPSALAVSEAPLAGRTGCGLGVAIQGARLPVPAVSEALPRTQTDCGLGAAAALRSASAMLPRARRGWRLDAEIQEVLRPASGSEAVPLTGRMDFGLVAAIQAPRPSAGAVSGAMGRTGCGPEAAEAEALPSLTASGAMRPGGSGSRVSEQTGQRNRGETGDWKALGPGEEGGSNLLHSLDLEPWVAHLSGPSSSRPDDAGVQEEPFRAFVEHRVVDSRLATAEAALGPR